MKDPVYKFRCGKVKAAGEKRIEKIKGRRLDSFSVGTAYFTVCVFPHGLWTLLKFCITVIFKFFLAQYLRKTRLLKIPVKNVDHKLDDSVPFKPQTVHTYLDFINFWIRPLSMLVKRFGMIQGVKLEIEFLRYIRFAYQQAFEIYRKNMSTTRRPVCKEIKAVRRMQKADPHYMCVPSLHIAVICLTYTFYKKIFVRENFTKEESDQWLKEIAEHGMEIAESVLYMKQHSVNCIPAALYMMTKIVPELLESETALTSIELFFKDSTDVKPEDKKLILEHIKSVYNSFTSSEKSWQETILNWLNNYEPYVKES